MRSTSRMLLWCLLLLPPSLASAVNCEQVRRYLETGRSAEDVADTMVVDVEQVKKCQRAEQSESSPPQQGNQGTVASDPKREPGH
jgi:hypothetical protein